MSRFSLWCLLALLSFTSACRNSPVPAAPPPLPPAVEEDREADARRASGLDLEAIDSGVAPGDDLYAFACGAWLRTATLPPGRPSYGFYDQREEEREQELQALIESPAANDELATLVHSLFACGLDEAAITRAGLDPLAERLREIEAIDDGASFTRALAHLLLIGVTPFLEIHRPVYWELDGTNHLYLRQSSLGSADGYLHGEEVNEDSIAEHRTEVRALLARLGRAPEDATRLAERIVAIERRLAARAATPDELRLFRSSYHALSPHQLRRLKSGIDWELFFAELDVPNTERVVIGRPEYFREIGRILEEEDGETIRTYLAWALLHETDRFLSVGSDDRAHAVAKLVAREMPRAIGTLYLREHFPETTRRRVTDLIANVRAAFDRRLRVNPWLHEDTKCRALVKLSRLQVLIGGPPPPPGYGDLVLSPDRFVENVFAVRERRWRGHLARIGETLDDPQWTVEATEANAWSQISRNSILLPAADINDFLRGDVDDAFLYGTLAATVAHEIIHGFDRQGRLYDEQGRRRDWWRDQDEAAIARMSAGLVAHYSGLSVEGRPVDGERTLDENLADVSGLRIAYDAWRLRLGDREPTVKDGFPGPQRFFLAHAQRWRELLSPEALRSRLAGWHSPPGIRANAPAALCPAFYEAFPRASEGTRNVIPEERILLW